MNENIAVIKEEKDVVYKSITLSFRNPKDLKEFRKLLCDFDEDIDTQNESEITYIVPYEGYLEIKENFNKYIENNKINSTPCESCINKDILEKYKNHILKCMEFSTKAQREYEEFCETNICKR